MELGVNRHIGAHRAGNRQQQRQLHVMIRLRHQGQQQQPRQRDDSQPDQGHQIQLSPGEKLPDLGLRQIDAHGEHRQGRIQGGHRAQAAPEHLRQPDFAQKQRQPDQHRDHEGRPDQLLPPEPLPERPPRQQGHAVGPLADVQEGHEGGHIEHRALPGGGDDQRDAEEPRIGEGAGEGSDRVPAEKRPGDQHREQQQDRRAGGAVQNPQQVRLRPLDQKAVDDRRRQRQIDQNIAQGPAALRGNLPAPVQAEAQPAQQEHLQDLPDQNLNGIHMGKPFASFSTRLRRKNRARPLPPKTRNRLIPRGSG